MAYEIVLVTSQGLAFTKLNGLMHLLTDAVSDGGGGEKTFEVFGWEVEH
jgi:hypothetical protein